MALVGDVCRYEKIVPGVHHTPTQKYEITNLGAVFWCSWTLNFCRQMACWKVGDIKNNFKEVVLFKTISIDRKSSATCNADNTQLRMQFSCIFWVTSEAVYVSRYWNWVCDRSLERWGEKTTRKWFWTIPWSL